MVQICSFVRFLERFCNCGIEWTEGSVIEFVELYKRQEIMCDPKHTLHLNKIKKQDVWEELRKEINRPVDECRKRMKNLLSSVRLEKMKMREAVELEKVSTSN